jgi:hypothetical protein
MENSPAQTRCCYEVGISEILGDEPFKRQDRGSLE